MGKHSMPDTEPGVRTPTPLDTLHLAIETYLTDEAARRGVNQPLLGDWVLTLEMGLPKKDLDPFGEPYLVVLARDTVSCDSARGLAVAAAATLSRAHAQHEHEDNGGGRIS